MWKIAVFGGGEWTEGASEWLLGVQVGEIIAKLGGTTVTGGYGGAMAAVSQGAGTAGGHTIGILHSPPVVKPPNPFVHEVVVAKDYLDRMSQLTQLPFAIALPGHSGTLAEIAVSIAMLQRDTGRSLALWAPWWKRKLTILLRELRADNLADLVWVETLPDVEKWLSTVLTKTTTT